MGEAKFSIPDEETTRVFKALDTENSNEIHYSEFLGAKVSSRIALHDDLLKSTFRRFDMDNSGYITREDLKQVLGVSVSLDGALRDMDRLVGGATYSTDGIRPFLALSDRRSEEATSHV